MRVVRFPPFPRNSSAAAQQVENLMADAALTHGPGSSKVALK